MKKLESFSNLKISDIESQSIVGGVPVGGGYGGTSSFTYKGDMTMTGGNWSKSVAGVGEGGTTMNTDFCGTITADGKSQDGCWTRIDGHWTAV